MLTHLPDYTSPIGPERHVTITTDEHEAGPFVVESVGLGEAFDPRGGRWSVEATRHNRCWPGTDSPWTFACHRRDDKGRIVYSAGWFSEQDCWLYLTSRGTVAGTVYNRQGEPETVERRGIGIPDAYVSRGLE